MSKIRFTDLGVRALTPGVYYDQALPAFGVRIGKHRRTWFVIQGSNRRRTTIGPYPDISLQDARKKALAIKTTEVPEEPSVLSFREARTLFLQNREKGLRVGSHKEITRILTKHFTWTKALDKITHNDVATAIDDIEMPSEANHAFKGIRTFFNWCVPRYLKPPCVGLKMPHKTQPRARVLTDEELRAVWAAADQSGVPGAIIKLLILTGQRKGEICALRHSWVKGDTVTLPREITKNGREHIVVIGPLAASLIEASSSETDLVFPARRRANSPFNGWSATKITFDKRADIAPWTLHDLRRTYASNMARLGTPIHVTERLLNHVSGGLGGIVGVYQRYDFQPEMREAMTKYQTWLLSILTS